ncbi:hypothetical protein N431DRAFT_531219 [Stipitochalara longipes BDJ]|nr:hypothetical protein N431DRAFT_531219 [Stipitochalara longipes BDJ]
MRAPCGRWSRDVHHHYHQKSIESLLSVPFEVLPSQDAKRHHRYLRRHQCARVSSVPQCWLCEFRCASRVRAKR